MFALSRAKNNQDEFAMPQVDLEVSEMGRTREATFLTAAKIIVVSNRHFT